MAFSHSKYIDVSQSTFNDVGRDQIHIGQIVHLHISLFGSRQTSPRVLGESSDVLASPTSTPDTSSQRRYIVPTYRLSEGISIVNAATALIVEIVRLLIGPQQSADKHRDLRLDLKALYESLVLTRTAIQEYENRPLGPSLINAVTSEVDRCHVVLEELFARVKGTWWGLNQTNIGGLWRPIFWSRWDGDEMALLKKKLSESRQSLRGFLMALNSVAWIELGNDLCTGHTSLNKFHTLLKQRLPSLRYIQLETVSVVDHLGRNLPVPTMFCSTWEGINHIITGYCKNSAGNRYVERGDYQLIRTEDNKTIGSIELAREVRSGMTLEMSIILQRMAIWDTELHEKTCPRCHHNNFNTTMSANGWIECQSCAGQFQVKSTEKGHSDDVKDGGMTTVGDSRGVDQTFDEVVSPASSASQTGEHVTSEDETQFFRRINIIYTKFPGLDEAPLHTGLLWYLNVHAAPPYRWQRCQALLYVHRLLLSWLAPGGGRGIVTLDLLNCTSIQPAASPTHPKARDDMGTIAARQQTGERGGHPLMDMLVPFHMLYSDGVERLAAESLLERLKWVNRIWLDREAINHPITLPDSSSVTRSPSITDSILTITDSEYSSSEEDIQGFA